MLNMNINNLLNLNKTIDIKSLPSQGLFYPDDFTIKIKKASENEIIQYEKYFDDDDVILTIDLLKNIVENNTIFSDGYDFLDIKSIDIIFIFIEIVKFSMNKKIYIELYTNDDILNIEFCPENFNYFIPDRELAMNYNPKSKEFLIDGFRFSLPNIGVEDSITEFLLYYIEEDKESEYNNYDYDFVYFLGDKKSLKMKEIENLLLIFNKDLDSDDKKKIKHIIDKFKVLRKYSLIVDDEIIDISARIDLKNIWK